MFIINQNFIILYTILLFTIIPVYYKEPKTGIGFNVLLYVSVKYITQ